MMKHCNRLAGLVILLGAAAMPVQASGQLPILKACLAEAEKAPDPKAARNQCIWNHWELMAEYGGP